MFGEFLQRLPVLFLRILGISRVSKAERIPKNHSGAWRDRQASPTGCQDRGYPNRCFASLHRRISWRFVDRTVGVPTPVQRFPGIGAAWLRRLTLFPNPLARRYFRYAHQLRKIQASPAHVRDELRQPARRKCQEA